MFRSSNLVSHYVDANRDNAPPRAPLSNVSDANTHVVGKKQNQHVLLCRESG